MGNATVICSDKTGTLTENVMTVVAGAFGSGSPSFGAKEYTQGEDERPTSHESEASSYKFQAHASMPSLPRHISPELRELLRQSIIANTTAFQTEEKGRLLYVGSKTETALLDLARSCLNLGNLDQERAGYTKQDSFPFNSERKCMGTAIKLRDGYRVLLKGAPETILEKCSKFPEIGLDTPPVQQDASNGGTEDKINQIISTYASNSLRTLGLAYRDFEAWPGDVEFADLLPEMPMENPTSAALRAAASFVPSPVTATTSPRD